MGIAAYNRGSMAIRRSFDMEADERRKAINSREIFCHEYIDSRNGETVRVWCDSIGPLVNQHRDHDGNVIRY